MKPIVIQYQTPVSLVNGSMYYGGIIVTAHQKMAVAFRENGLLAVDINSLLRELLPEWYASLNQMKQHLLIRRLIDEIIASEDADVSSAFSNNIDEILQSIRTLVEIGVGKDQLPENNRAQKIFKDIYDSFLNAAESGAENLSKVFQKWNDCEYFSKALSLGVQQKTQRKIGYHQAVYFQGFYYIRPMQCRLIGVCKKICV